ncbi:hypothetical protein C8F01DRAFT_1325964 [Mycena amicta]|nr:hypothetical protein C8F01DRAFT_1325964 [Mycena amicta]
MDTFNLDASSAGGSDVHQLYSGINVSTSYDPSVLFDQASWDGERDFGAMLSNYEQQRLFYPPPVPQVAPHAPRRPSVEDELAAVPIPPLAQAPLNGLGNFTFDNPDPFNSQHAPAPQYFNATSSGASTPSLYPNDNELARPSWFPTSFAFPHASPTDYSTDFNIPNSSAGPTVSKNPTTLDPIALPDQFSPLWPGYGQPTLGPVYSPLVPGDYLSATAPQLPFPIYADSHHMPMRYATNTQPPYAHYHMTGSPGNYERRYYPAVAVEQAQEPSQFQFEEFIQPAPSGRQTSRPRPLSFHPYKPRASAARSSSTNPRKGPPPRNNCALAKQRLGDKELKVIYAQAKNLEAISVPCLWDQCNEVICVMSLTTHLREVHGLHRDGSVQRTTCRWDDGCVCPSNPTLLKVQSLAHHIKGTHLKATHPSCTGCGEVFTRPDGLTSHLKLLRGKED